MALLVHLIARRPCTFLVPLVDSGKWNVEQIATSSVVKRASPIHSWPVRRDQPPRRRT